MISDFTNDSAYISTHWLLRMIIGRGHRVQHLLKISRMGTVRTTHSLAILNDGLYLCDCCMGVMLGIPCRHYFQALTVVKGLKFHLAVVRPRLVIEFYPKIGPLTLPNRWYQNPSLDPNSVLSTSCEYTPPESRCDLGDLQTSMLPSALIISNPLAQPTSLVSPSTMTIPARTVLHSAEAAFRPLLHGVQMQEQLDSLLNSIHNLR